MLDTLIATAQLSISGTVVDQNNYRELTTELKAECDFQKYKWMFSKDLCRHLQKCYQFLHDRYDRQQEACSTDKSHEEL